eukprot:2865389-Rhodomonas_salina.1
MILGALSVTSEAALQLENNCILRLLAHWAQQGQMREAVVSDGCCKAAATPSISCPRPGVNMACVLTAIDPDNCTVTAISSQ